MNVPTKNNAILQQVLENVLTDKELNSLWEVVNTNAIKRLGMSDHGPVHMQIVANLALKILRLLHSRNVVTSLEKDYDFPYDDAEVVVFLASITHDLGMSIQRKNHEEMSLFVASPIIHRILADIYPVEKRTIIVAETLHAIIAHRADGKPLTVEAGVVRVADALDMAEGRSRIAFDAGQINIHSVSAMAIRQIVVEPGEAKPIHLTIYMNNSAGIFQVDGLFQEKIKGSGLENYMSLTAVNNELEEKRIVREYSIE